MTLTPMIREFALAGAKLRLAEIQAEIATLLATFPGLQTATAGTAIQTASTKHQAIKHEDGVFGQLFGQLPDEKTLAAIGRRHRGTTRRTGRKPMSAKQRALIADVQRKRWAKWREDRFKATQEVRRNERRGRVLAAKHHKPQQEQLAS